MFKDGSPKLGCTTEVCSGTPMVRWAGEGKDWMELMTQTQLRKEDVIRNLLESMKQPVNKKKGAQRICADKETKGYLESDRHLRSKRTKKRLWIG